jgi:hypothetical protein
MITETEQAQRDTGILEDQAVRQNQGQLPGTAAWSVEADKSTKRLQQKADGELLERILNEHLRTGCLGPAATAAHYSTNTNLAPDLKAETARGHDRVPCPEYQVLASRLVGYAMPVFKNLLRTGKIKKELLALNLPHTLTSDDYQRLHTSMAARDALALAVVRAGEEHFRRKIIPNRTWRADGRASLETYFVGGCLYNFAVAVRTWKREHPEWSGFNANSDCSLDDAKFSFGSTISTLDTPDEVVGNRDLIRHLIRIASPLVGRIMVGILEGYTFAEIGEQLGLSARAIEGRVHRFRTQLKEDARRGRLEIPPGLIQRREAA